MLGVSGNECFDGLAQLGGAFDAEAAERLPGQDPKPNLHLIEPTGGSGREMEMNIGMAGQPRVAFLVGAVIVQDHVQFLLRSGVGHHLVHELEELFSPLQLRDGGLDLAGGDGEGGKEVEGSMAFVRALVGADDRAVVRFHVTGLSFQRLDAGLFIDRDHQRLLRRVEIEPDDIGRFGGELLVGAHAPRALPLQADALAA
ncbi:MAG: hypothetical protein BWX44_01756 [Spirochaetes bacterium ADurb.Bin001]|nr:MAG: hypothetical protein BWX44_01756 [Spirochaetes bacterium ADurb.Bin001]